MKMTIKTPADLEAETREREAEAAKVEARAYLAATDWMVARMAETGKAVPKDVAEARAAARRALN